MRTELEAEVSSRPPAARCHSDTSMFVRFTNAECPGLSPGRGPREQGTELPGKWRKRNVSEGQHLQQRPPRPCRLPWSTPHAARGGLCCSSGRPGGHSWKPGMGTEPPLSNPLQEGGGPAPLGLRLVCVSWDPEPFSPRSRTPPYAEYEVLGFFSLCFSGNCTGRGPRWAPHP